jgi:ribose-phosphate pyrophosphokinase
MHSDVLVMGSSSSKLVKAVSDKLKKSFISYTINQFADTESHFSIPGYENIEKKTVLLVYQFSLEFSVDNQLFKLLLLSQKIKELKAQELILLLPYCAYSRQDACTDYGSRGIIHLVVELLKSAGVDELFVCEMHNASVVPETAIPLHVVDLSLFWADIIAKNIISQNRGSLFCIASPDEGGRQRTRKVAQLLDIDHVFLRKKRIAVDCSAVFELVGDVKDKAIILLDDILNTGTTAVSASALLKKQGAKDVFGCFTHAVFSSNAKKLHTNSVFKKIYISDTIQLDQFFLLQNIFEPVSVNAFLSKEMYSFLR